MEFPELYSQCIAALQAETRLTLVLPRPWKLKPKGWPRGELLCEQPNTNVYSYSPAKIMDFLIKNGLVKITLADPTQSVTADAMYDEGK
jgi:hypothetical protein